MTMLMVIAAVGTIVLAVQNWKNNYIDKNSNTSIDDESYYVLDEDDDSNDDDNVGVDVSSTTTTTTRTAARFPWEPVVLDDDKKKIHQNPVRRHKEKPKYQFRDRGVPVLSQRHVGTIILTMYSRKGSNEDSKQQQQQRHHDVPESVIKTSLLQHQRDQLDFIAGMTFANGGIRPPNCPCCY